MLFYFLATAAICLSAVAVLRCYLPPATRDVQALTSRVELLEERVAQLGELVTKRERHAILAAAREAKAGKSAQQEMLAAEAAAVIEAARRPAAPVEPLSPEEQRAATLRELRSRAAVSLPRR